MRIMIFHASAGHGHQKVAEVIEKALLKIKRAEDEVHLYDALDLTPGFFSCSYKAIYFQSVKWTPQLWGASYEFLDKPGPYACIRPIREIGNSLIGRKILAEVRKIKPDVIVCTHFLTAELLSRAKQQGKIKARMVIVVTDYYPHTFWVHPASDDYWIMSEEGLEDLVQREVARGKIHPDGIPVDPKFMPGQRKREVLERFGFSPDRFTILLTSGSFGLGPQKAILENMAGFKDKIQVFVVCGRNQSMTEELSRQTFGFPVKVFGFVDFMHELMEASDLMIAKPGGATTTESLAKGLVMVVLDPIPGQETRNVRLLGLRDTSFFMKDPAQIQLILKNIFEKPEMLEAKKEHIRGLAKPEAARHLAEWILNG